MAATPSHRQRRWRNRIKQIYLVLQVSGRRGETAVCRRAQAAGPHAPSSIVMQGMCVLKRQR